MTMETGWDLVVAGAGPAGCVLAAKVALGGGSVLLLEKGEAPGQGEDWVVDVGRDTFEAVGVPAPGPPELFDEPAHTFIVTSDRSSSVELPGVPMVPVRNGPYVRKLAAWAEAAGVEMRTGVEVAGPVIESGAVRGVRLSDGETLGASVTADCTGIRGVLRSGTPEAWGLCAALHPSDVVLARRETRAVDAEAAAKDMARNEFRDGDRYDRVGSQGVYSVETVFLDLKKKFVDILIGVKPGSGPSPEERFEEILSRRPYIGERLFGDGAAIPIRRPLDTFAADGLLVVGDSACQVIPAHGSGTASAMIAAGMASVVVLRAIETGRADRRALWGYCYAFQSTRGALLAYYDVIREHTSTLTVEDLDAMIGAGMVTGGDVYSGLVPEVPGIRAVDVLARAKPPMAPPRLLAGVARAGLKAQLTLRHYMDYPPLDAPGALERWSASMPGGMKR